MRLWTIAGILIMGGLAAAIMGPSCNQPPPVYVDYYCVPKSIMEDASRVEITCVAPSGKRCGYPEDPPGSGNKIKAFATPTDNSDYAHRFSYLANAAINSGMTLHFSFVEGNTAGTSFGCAADSCRWPAWIRLVPFPPPWPETSCP
jgi:hypothetical protein